MSSMCSTYLIQKVLLNQIWDGKISDLFQYIWSIASEKSTDSEAGQVFEGSQSRGSIKDHFLLSIIQEGTSFDGDNGKGFCCL